MYKDIILKLIEYARFSSESNYIQFSFYEYFDDVNDEELDKIMEELERYCNNKK